MLLLGCSAVNGKGETIVQTAVSSPLEHVRKWGREKELPLRLEKNTERLLKTIQHQDYESARKHTSMTRCLDYKTWIDADLSVEDPLPSVTTFLEILSHCISSDHDEKFALWLCDELFPSRDRHDDYFNKFFNKSETRYLDDILS